MRAGYVFLKALVGLGGLASLATPAAAQIGPPRPFTQIPIDPNRNNGIGYVPIYLRSPGPRPPELPYNVASATWYREPLGSWNRPPDKNLDGARYRLEQFEAVREPGENILFRIAITRRPGLAPGASPPQLRVIDTTSQLVSLTQGTPEPVTEGVLYRFELRPPILTPELQRAVEENAIPPSYELRFLPARGVELPQVVRHAPTFGGAPIEVRMAMPPPRLPQAERVAGRRIEYRSGRVVETR